MEIAKKYKHKKTSDTIIVFRNFLNINSITEM